LPGRFPEACRIAVTRQGDGVAEANRDACGETGGQLEDGYLQRRFVPWPDRGMALFGRQDDGEIGWRFGWTAISRASRGVLKSLSLGLTQGISILVQYRPTMWPCTGRGECVALLGLPWLFLLDAGTGAVPCTLSLPFHRQGLS
jgi:hypothetical protein